MRALRWRGFAAVTLMAVSAYLAGSPAHRDAAWVIGVVVWFAAGALLVVTWLTLGRHDEVDPRWLLVTGALWSLPLLLAPPLGSHDVYAYACQGQLFEAGRDLYTVGPDALPCSWLDAVPALWRGTPTPYGPLWLAIEGAAAWIAGTSLPIAVTAFRLVAIAGTLLAVAAGTHLAKSCGGAPGMFVRLAAISPLVLIHVVSGAHNDVLLAGLVLSGLAIAAAQNHHPVRRAALAGVAFGLAAGVKATALAAAPFALPLLLGGRLRLSRLVTHGLVVAVAVGGTYAALAAATNHGLGFLRALNSTSSMVQWLSVPTGVGMAIGYVLRAVGLGTEPFGTAVAVTRAIGFVALGVVLVALFVWTVRRVRESRAIVTAAGLALLATALLGPVFYAWYAIGGIAVLAATPLAGRPRTAVTVAAGGLIFLTLPDSLGLATKTKVPGAFLDLALVVGLAVWWTRRLRRPAPVAGGPPR
jgi:hypothetical protein